MIPCDAEDDKSLDKTPQTPRLRVHIVTERVDELQTWSDSKKTWYDF